VGENKKGRNKLREEKNIERKEETNGGENWDNCEARKC
jgi:hypothetical protein